MSEGSSAYLTLKCSKFLESIRTGSRTGIRTTRKARKVSSICRTAAKLRTEMQTHTGIPCILILEHFCAAECERKKKADPIFGKLQRETGMQPILCSFVCFCVCVKETKREGGGSPVSFGCEVGGDDALQFSAESIKGSVYWGSPIKQASLFSRWLTCCDPHAMSGCSSCG